MKIYLVLLTSCALTANKLDIKEKKGFHNGKDKRALEFSEILRSENKETHC